MTMKNNPGNPQQPIHSLRDSRTSKKNMVVHDD